MKMKVAVGISALTLMLLLIAVFMEIQTGDWIAYLLIGLWLMPLSVVGVAVVKREPTNRIGWILLAITFLIVLHSFATTYGEYVFELDHRYLPLGLFAAWLSLWLIIPAFGLFIILFLRFPGGRLVSAKWRWVEYAGITGMCLGSLAFMVRPGPTLSIPSVDNPLGINALDDVASLAEGAGSSILTFVGIAAIVSLIARYRRSGGERRQQLKWIAFSAAMLPVFFLLGQVVGTIDRTEEQIFTFLTIMAGAILLPLSIGVSILKYRLYDVDVVINKTIVFGSLAAFITGIYVAIVVGIGTLLGSQDEPNLALSIAATAIVAIAFSPVKERTQRIANRLVYGQRATPYEALARFTDEVATSYETDRVAPAMAKTIVDATGAERAEVWLALDHTLVRAAGEPDAGETPEAISLGDDMRLDSIPGADVTSPVIHNDELLGALTLTKKRGEAPTPVDNKLLDDLAAQAGIVLRNSRLTAELRARLDQITRTAAEIRESRQRIVSAQDKARRGLERDIHDGAQQHLVALAVKLNLAKAMATKKPERAGAMLAQLKDEAQEALHTLDELAQGIYPPVLAEHGIARAIETRADKTPFALRIDDETEDRFESHIEASAYFCILEALQNVAKYANSTTATVTLEQREGTLTFTVTDDGAGFDPATTDYGTGIHGMGDRLAAVGGTIDLTSAPGTGTTVTGLIPTAVKASA
jgi:signal transduction histidine kinase